PRLQREGISLPAIRLRDPERRLFRRLERVHGPRAHARYPALVDRVVAFADACRRARFPQSARSSCSIDHATSAGELVSAAWPRSERAESAARRQAAAAAACYD